MQEKLKATGTIYWHSPNNGATNETGFTALPGGCRGFGGTFYEIGDDGYWWSSTQNDPNESTAWWRSRVIVGKFVNLFNFEPLLHINGIKINGHNLIIYV